MVMLRAKTSDWAKTANTDANGQFELNAVPLGEYSVSVASPGFVQTDQNVEVNSGTVPVVHFQLRVGRCCRRAQRLNWSPFLAPPCTRFFVFGNPCVLLQTPVSPLCAPRMKSSR